MKHRAVKCQWKLSSSLFLLLSILLFSVFAKKEPLTFLALLVFSEQAALLLLTKFLLSPQNQKRPFFPEHGEYLDIAKTTATFDVPHPSLAGDPQSSWSCISFQEAAALTALPGDRTELCSSSLVAQSQVSHCLRENPKGWMLMSWSTGVSSAPTLSPLLLLVPALGAGAVPPSPRHLLQGLLLFHPLQG